MSCLTLTVYLHLHFLVVNDKHPQGLVASPRQQGAARTIAAAQEPTAISGIPVQKEATRFEPVVIGDETLYRKVAVPMRGPVEAISDPIILDFAKLHDHFNSYLGTNLPTNRHFLHFQYIQDKIQAILDKHNNPFQIEMILPWASEEEFLENFVGDPNKWNNILLNVFKLRCVGCWRCGDCFYGESYGNGVKLSCNAHCDHYKKKNFNLGEVDSIHAFELLEEAVGTMGSCSACNNNK